ncbi:putative pentatricopeptide repeat protein [Erysiphe neolycopersici]|uniref:Putative pentatricopeptide repeat protein n=1 Tax=Erysiphe neolycopersici TaxID=212602 RepID=A0A420HMX7_9PEZI|nr:putative pentatricopeptide repeat protein [Erysiphe neolycopersici]
MTLRHASPKRVRSSPFLDILEKFSRPSQTHHVLQCVCRQVHIGEPAKQQASTIVQKNEISQAAFVNQIWQREIISCKRIEDFNPKTLNCQLHLKDVAKLQKILDFRWRQLIIWLNTISKYRINSPKLIQWPKRKDSMLKPRISNKDVRNLLQEITEGISISRSHRFYSKKTMWLEFMAKILYSHPNRALDALEALVKILPDLPCVPQTAVADIIHCIIIHYFHDTTLIESEDLMRIATRIIDILHSIPSSLVLPLSDHCLFLLLSNLPGANLEHLYVYLTKNNAKLSIWTIMQFCSRLAKAGHIEFAFEAVQKLTRTNCHLNKSNALSVFTSVLHCSNLDPEAQINTIKIFQYLISSGVKPNIFLYNVVLHSLIKNQEPHKAWNFYERMSIERIESDVTTYSILLNDAKRRLDTPTINRIVQIIRKHGKTSGHIITDIIHAIFLLHQKSPLQSESSDMNTENPQAIFSQMLQIYIEYFKLDQLFILVPGLSDAYVASSNLEKKKPLWDPPAPTLCVMVTGFLGMVDSSGAKRFYEHFKTLVRTGNPAVASLVKTTYIYNVILMCFYKFEDRAKDAPDVIANMLLHEQEITVIDPSFSKADSSCNDFETSKKVSSPSLCCAIPHSPAKPDVYTWSILVKIFMRLRYTRSAEKVLSMMVRRNIQPEMVTWTSLIAGYARMQNPIMTANAVQRFEEAGFESDDHIHRVLSKVWQQNKLINEMEYPRPREIKPVTSKWIDDLKDNLAVDIAENSIDDLHLSS